MTLDQIRRFVQDYIGSRLTHLNLEVQTFRDSIIITANSGRDYYRYALDMITLSYGLNSPATLKELAEQICEVFNAALPPPPARASAFYDPLQGNWDWGASMIKQYEEREAQYRLTQKRMQDATLDAKVQSDMYEAFVYGGMYPKEALVDLDEPAKDTTRYQLEAIEPSPIPVKVPQLDL